MKLLHVIPKMDPTAGGVCEAVRNIIKALNFCDTYNEVVSLDDSDAPFIGNDKFTIHTIGPGKSPWIYSPKLNPWLLENLSRFNVVVVHGLWLYPSYAVFNALKTIKRKNIANEIPQMFVMPHGMLDPYFQNSPDRKLKALRNSLYWKLIEKKVVNSADGLLFTCTTEQELASIPFPSYYPKRETVVGLGINEAPTELPSMKEAFLSHCPTLKGSPYFLSLSRIHEKKGIDILIQAYAEIYSNRIATDDQPKMVIAGPIDNSRYGMKLKDLVADLQLQDRVLFPGMLTGLVKWGAIYGCSAFVSSSHQENFGISVVEAMSCSRPVLISNKINIWQEIKNSGGGLIADDTKAAFQSLLQTWKNMPSSEMTMMGKNAKACYQKHFANDTAGQKFLSALAN